jgi:hypothetical protein
MASLVPARGGAGKKTRRAAGAQGNASAMANKQATTMEGGGREEGEQERNEGNGPQHQRPKFPDQESFPPRKACGGGGKHHTCGRQHARKRPAPF